MNRFTGENLSNIKNLVSEGTGVNFEQKRSSHIRMRAVLVAAVILVLATAGVYAGYQISLSRNVIAPDNTGQGSSFSPDGGFYISKPFGMVTDQSEYTREHAGVDFPADEGTPVLAAADGTVVYADFTGGYGNCVIIDHGDGYSTMYAHMEEILVAPGDAVSRGDEIGTVGSTGMSTGPHLHFEFRIDEEPTDPEDYWE